MKTVLITGTSRGLGKALAETFVAADWQVIATSRSGAGQNTPSLRHLPLDLGTEDSPRVLAATLRDTGARIDLVINNAGTNPKDHPDPGYFQSTFKVAHFSADAVTDSLRVNALMPMQLVSGLLPILSEDAVVLNVSSWLGSITAKTNPGHYGYAGSKALLNMFTKGLALEWQDTPRAAVALNPGWMQTDMGGPNAKTTPAEVARAVLRLHETGALHRANGAFLNVDGSEHPW